MKIFITGGTGFVGTYLSRELISHGHTITILGRALSGRGCEADGICYLEGNPAIRGPWQNYVGEHDAVINLAGASIFSRWTRKRKELIRTSRIETTRNIVEALPADSGHVTLLSASAVGYYGFHEDEELMESSPPGSDFLARTAFDWEQAAMVARDKGARVLTTRFGIVLGKNGGALGLMIPMFRYFIGGALGSGNQWFPWIHVKDLALAFIFILGKKDITGAFNFCSPEPVRNKELAKAIGKVLRRPSFFPVPGLLIRLILGEFGRVLLKGQRAIPGRLLEEGFRFHYPGIEEALKDILKK